MKKAIYLFMILAALAGVALGTSSCRRWSDNGKIDGYWQIREIYYIADGTEVHPTDLFIAVQLELLQLQNPGYSSELTGVLAYDKKQDYFTVDFRYNPSEQKLNEFGFTGTVCTVHIDEASSNTLVLSTPIAIIRCRRY